MLTAHPDPTHLQFKETLKKTLFTTIWPSTTLRPTLQVLSPQKLSHRNPQPSGGRAYFLRTSWRKELKHFLALTLAVSYSSQFLYSYI